MSEAKRLLAEATPLPWRRSGPGPEPDGDQVWLVGNGNQAQFIAWTDASLESMADFDLAAYAVNHLPAYEAIVEALERLIDRTTYHGTDCYIDSGLKTCECGVQQDRLAANLALRRLREDPA